MISYEVLELKGYKSLRAFNVFHTLMLGIKMLPMHLGETYENFYNNHVKELDDEGREALVRQAALFVEIPKDEVEAVLGFVADPNGIPYQPANLKNLGPDQIYEIIVAVCTEVGKIKIDMVSSAEKKK